MATKKDSKKKNSPVKSVVPLQPLGDRVVVKPLSEEERGTKTLSGIIIPDSAQEKSSEGTIVAVGPGRYDEGKHIPVAVHIGDRVMFSKYGHEEVKVNGVEYYIVSESQLLAVVTK